MTQEENRKIWVDLSARVMHHPKIRVTNTYLNQTYDEVLTMANFTQFSDVRYEIKPFLRPMSSMTEEEINESYWLQQNSINIKEYEYEGGYEKSIDFPYLEDFIDWLNSHHFDYRGLIKKGLALEAPDGMYR